MIGNDERYTTSCVDPLMLSPTRIVEIYEPPPETYAPMQYYDDSDDSRPPSYYTVSGGLPHYDEVCLGSEGPVDEPHAILSISTNLPLQG